MRLIALLLLSTMSHLHGQIDSTFRLKLAFGVEAHDKRLYNLPLSPTTQLRASQPELFGTYSIETGFDKGIGLLDRLHLSLGVNHIIDIKTFRRPFQNKDVPPDALTDLLLRYTGRYRQLIVAPTIGLYFKMLPRWYFFTELQPRVRYHLAVSSDLEPNRYKLFKEWGTEIESLESYLGSTYVANRISFSLTYRIANYSHIDNNLRNNTVSFPEKVVSGYEWSNPLKFHLAVGYSL